MRRALQAALKARAAAKAREAETLHALALALGRVGAGGFAPVVVPQDATRRESVATIAVTAPTTAMRRRPDAATASLPAVGTPGAEPSGYRAVVVAAKAEAAQRRVVREAGRAAMRLPSREAVFAERSFAPTAFSAGAPPAPPRRAAALPVERALPFAFGDETAETLPLSASALAPEHTPRPPRREARTAASTPAARTPSAPGAAFAAQIDVERVLDDYFYRMSRMPLSGTTAFDPRLTPIWPGMKVPG